MIKFVQEIYHGRGSSAAALQSLITKILVIVLGAGTSLVVARLLGPQGRGEMSALIVWSGFLSGLLTLGLPSSIIFNLRAKPEERSGIIGAGLILALALSVAVGVAGYVALPLWLKNYSAADIAMARWFLFSSPIPIFIFVGRAAMEANGRFSSSNFALWFGPLVTLLILGGLAAGHLLTPVTAGLAYVLGNVPAVASLIVQVWKHYHPAIRGFPAISRNLFHYGLRSWGVDLLNALASQADQVLIVRFLSPAAMGTYIVAANLARLIGVFQGSAVMVLFPRVAAQSNSEIMSLTSLAVRISTACAAFTAVTIGLVGPYLLNLLYGHAYVEDGTAVFRIMLLDVVLGGATQILAQAFMAAGRPGTVTVIQGIGVGIAIAIMPLFILKFGVAGAAGSLLISSAIRLTLTLICFRTVLKVPPPSIFPKWSDVGFIAARIRGFVPKPAVEVVTVGD